MPLRLPGGCKCVSEWLGNGKAVTRQWPVNGRLYSIERKIIPATRVYPLAISLLSTCHCQCSRCQFIGTSSLALQMAHFVAALRTLSAASTYRFLCLISIGPFFFIFSSTSFLLHSLVHSLLPHLRFPHSACTLQSGLLSQRCSASATY